MEEILNVVMLTHKGIGQSMHFGEIVVFQWFRFRRRWLKVNAEERALEGIVKHRRVASATFFWQTLWRNTSWKLSMSSRQERVKNRTVEQIVACVRFSWRSWRGHTRRSCGIANSGTDRRCSCSSSDGEIVGKTFEHIVIEVVSQILDESSEVVP